MLHCPGVTRQRTVVIDLMNLEAKALDFEILWRDAVLTFAGLVVIIIDNLWNSCSRTVKMLARRDEQRHDLVLPKVAYS